MKLTFHGGAREVTGACYLLETEKTKILVDCGLFQGSQETEDLNPKPFQFNPSEIAALFVTHAHIDHIGRIPKLIHDGFQGKIYSTAPTRAIAHLLLEDAFGLEEREGHSFYTKEDIERAFNLWEEVPYDHKFSPAGGIEVQLKNSGHILGSSFVEFWIEGKHILFTGDFGNVPSVLLSQPASVEDIDYLIIESAYGNKFHESGVDRELFLERAVEDVVAKKGTLMIPAFATERTQDVLFLLNSMLSERRIPDLPIFVDSPLAIKITHAFERYPAYYKEEIQTLFKAHPHLFQFKRLQLTESVEDSKAINNVAPPKVIIAGSGMMNGGRILHHVKRYISDSRSILLIVGYQGAGSLGRRLLDGEKFVKIFGEDLEVRADIRHVGGFSAHADNTQLFSFVENTRAILKHVFVVQGEDAAALHLTQEIRDRLGVTADAPELYNSFELN